MGRLQNLQEAELLETYLGDNAHEFKWTSPHSAACSVRANKHDNISMQITLEEYPAQTAQVSLRLIVGQSMTVVRKVLLADPDQIRVMRRTVDNLLITFKEEERSDGNLNT